MDKRIVILVVAYNAVQKLGRTLDRIPEAVWKQVDEVFLSDDCSTDHTYDAAIGYKHTKQLKKLTIHRNEQNLGYGGNQKAGYDYAIRRGFDIVVLLHGDGQYAPELLGQLLEPLLNDEADMVFGSRMTIGTDPLAGGMPFYKYVGNRILTRLQNAIVGTNLSEFHSGYRLYSCAALSRIPFRLNSDLWHFDTEILIQFHEAQLRIVELPIPTYYGDEICYVNGLAYALNCMKAALRYKFHKTRLLYDPKYDLGKERYTYKQTDPYSSHKLILQWIEEQRPASVLEVGTASGYLTGEMASRGCQVTGIECDEQLASTARQHCHEMIVADIETLDFDNLDLYDAVVFGDVIEHLKNPAEILRRSARLLKPGGKILISLPNIANIWIRLGLLFGRFNYRDTGILDRTHLRFFTLKTMKQLITESGFDVTSIHPTPIPLPLILPLTGKGKPLSFLHFINWRLTKVRQTLFAYQFVAVCELTKEPKAMINSTVGTLVETPGMQV